MTLLPGGHSVLGCRESGTEGTPRAAAGDTEPPARRGGQKSASGKNMVSDEVAAKTITMFLPRAQRALGVGALVVGVFKLG